MRGAGLPRSGRERGGEVGKAGANGTCGRQIGRKWGREWRAEAAPKAGGGRAGGRLVATAYTFGWHLFLAGLLVAKAYTFGWHLFLDAPIPAPAAIPAQRREAVGRLLFPLTDNDYTSRAVVTGAV